MILLNNFDLECLIDQSKLPNQDNDSPEILRELGLESILSIYSLTKKTPNEGKKQINEMGVQWMAVHKIYTTLGNWFNMSVKSPAKSERSDGVSATKTSPSASDTESIPQATENPEEAVPGQDRDAADSESEDDLDDSDIQHDN